MQELNPLPYHHLSEEGLLTNLGWVVFLLDSPPLHQPEQWALTPHGIGNEILNHGADLDRWRLTGDAEEWAELFVATPKSHPRRAIMVSIWHQLRAGRVTDQGAFVSLWCQLTGQAEPPPAPPTVAGFGLRC